MEMSNLSFGEPAGGDGEPDLREMVRISRKKRSEAAKKLKDATAEALSCTPANGVVIPKKPPEEEEEEEAERPHEMPPLREALSRSYARRKLGVSKLKKSVERAVGEITP